MKESDVIQPWNKIAVKAPIAAQMMGCGRSTFFQRVKDGIYPKPGPDGQWSVEALRSVHQASSTTTASAPDAAEDTRPGCTPPAPHQFPGAPVAVQ